MDAAQLIAEGRLDEAIEALSHAVKGRPADQDLRGFLAVLLCYAGNLERADKQLDAMVRMDPGVEMGVALMRQLVRAEQWRQQFLAEGRIPEFLQEPDGIVRKHLEASVMIREGALGEAAEVLAAAEEERSELAGEAGGVAFDDFRDLDDLIGPFFEVLTSTGKYYWVPMSSVQELAFHPPEKSRDLLWRRATLAVREGPEGDVYLPAIYGPARPELRSTLRMGRETEWIGGDGTPVRGVGLRTFLFGDESKTILELETISFQGQAARGPR